MTYWWRVWSYDGRWTFWFYALDESRAREVANALNVLGVYAGRGRMKFSVQRGPARPSKPNPGPPWVSVFATRERQMLTYGYAQNWVDAATVRDALARTNARRMAQYLAQEQAPGGRIAAYG